MQCDPLAFEPSPAVADCIRALGRTEDVMFSPDQTRLAIAGFVESKILVIDVKVVTKDGALSVRSRECVELHCPEFDYPHGLAWVDDSTLVVANRERDVIVVSVPPLGKESRAVEVGPLLRLSQGGEGIISSPGSVTVARLSDRHFDFLVCNNYRHNVSRHIVQRGNGFEILASHRLFEHGLKVPDSIAVSGDGALVAVSNHYGRRIDLFRSDAHSTPQTPPEASLAVPHYPHGLRFAMQDRLLLVADAGAPFVHVFARNGRSWQPMDAPTASFQVIDEKTFLRGQTNPEEGGPKGLDLLGDGSVLVVSCEEVPIAFFDFRSARDQLAGAGASDEPEHPSGETRLLETMTAALKGQQDQIGAQKAEIAKLKAERDQDRKALQAEVAKRKGAQDLARKARQVEAAKSQAPKGQSLDRRFFGMVRRAALKAFDSVGKK